MSKKPRSTAEIKSAEDLLSAVVNDGKKFALGLPPALDPGFEQVMADLEKDAATMALDLPDLDVLDMPDLDAQIDELTRTPINTNPVAPLAIERLSDVQAVEALCSEFAGMTPARHGGLALHAVETSPTVWRVMVSCPLTGKALLITTPLGLCDGVAHVQRDDT